jgi:hypothetical protein
MNRPPQIQPEHLTKTALVYVRSSSLNRSWDPSRSTSALVEQATLWGWPNSQIQVLAENAGTSAPLPGTRPAFRQLLTALESGEVAIVFASDLSRLFRYANDGHDLLRTAVARSVLLAVDGQLLSPRDLSDRLSHSRRLSFSRSYNSDIPPHPQT